MRILVVSNLYPPHHIGGYELSCRQAALWLKARGHDVRVLTSTYGVDHPQTDGEVYRWLQSDLGWENQITVSKLQILKRELRNQSAFKRIAKEFQPDIVYFWNLTNISIAIVFLAQHMRIPTCFYIGDMWLRRWRSDRWYALWPPKPRRHGVLLARLANRSLRSSLKAMGTMTTDKLELQNVQFASGFLKRTTEDAGEFVGDPEILYWGIDEKQFASGRDCQPVRRLLYVGQVVPHKGVHTAIEAVRFLVNDFGKTFIKLTIVGGSAVPEYVSRLRETVKAYGLEQNIEFRGQVSRELLPNIYSAHDALICPSIIDEGLGLTILEGMASGLPVVGTASGGSAELIEHEVNGLIFPKEDAATCAAHILRLMDDPDFAKRLSENGRRMVESRYLIDKVLGQIERTLYRLCGAARG